MASSCVGLPHDAGAGIQGWTWGEGTEVEATSFFYNLTQEMCNYQYGAGCSCGGASRDRYTLKCFCYECVGSSLPS